MERLIVDIIANPIVFYSVLFFIILLIIITFIKMSKNKQSSLNNIDDVKQIDYVKEDQEDEKVTKSKVELESLLSKMENDLDKPVEKEPDVFEKKQEEDSIISYQELLKAKESGKIDIVDDEEIEKKIDEEGLIKEVEEEQEEIKEEPKDKIEDLVPNPFEKPKLQKQEVISPVFGYGSSDDLYKNMRPKEEVIKEKLQKEENKKELEKVQEEPKEIKKGVFSDEDLAEIIEFDTDDIENSSEQFLKALKEFRKNLE